jgi:chromosome segregation protein
MYLRKVEISGFKSFAGKTVLDFAPASKLPESAVRGITAIVGPNGSGKSNTADAIRWAIGEQSSKNLRGKKAEDVIFAGTSKRAKVGTASVTLYFDNRDKRIPIEFEEVSVTRKLHRSGESEFLINGAKVRLLDIADLLAKAGIGKDSYSVITQGMSDAVLSASPIDRRSIFEDAAGVKQYQLQKERAIRKLDTTRENIAKADSLIAEIEPSLRILKRQAEAAEKGRDVKERLLSKQLDFYGYLWHSFQGERGGLSSEREHLAREVGMLERETDSLREELTKLASTVEDNGHTRELARGLAELRTEQNGFERELAIALGRIEIEEEKRKVREEVNVIPVDLRYVRTTLDRIRKHQEELISRIGGAEKLEDLQDIREFARVIFQELADLDTKAEAGSVKETVIITLPEAEQRASDERLARLSEEKARLQTEMERVRGAIAEKDAAIRTEEDRNRAGRERYFAIERDLREKDKALSVLKDALNDVKVKLARVEVREEDLINETREELSMDVRDLSWDGTPRDKETLAREIARLKGENERVGAIDPLVVEEYEETAKRYEFLVTESADLRSAIVSLETVIREMEGRIEKEFETAFEEIRKKFEHYFTLIFNGGKAELIKTKVKGPKRGKGEEGAEWEEGEPMEGEKSEAETERSGIDIFACPPGKKITNLSMLSGGERSLTSLALLFAIISHNPPPFAVLDEVEAALDEANSKRFGKVLQELSERTQFIVITHNRETMREASLLYGVTMGEDGVSQVLSLHLEDAEKLRGEK